MKGLKLKATATMVALTLAGAAYAGGAAHHGPVSDKVAKSELGYVQSPETQMVMENPDGTLEDKGVRTLHDYIITEKEMWDFLFDNHPIFTKYAKEGRMVGKPHISDRGEEYLHGGNSAAYSEKMGRPMAVQYRLGAKSTLDFPNKFVGPEKCGECHGVQYEKWKRSRHAQVVRFPEEVKAAEGDPEKGWMGTDVSILPEGITSDAVYAIIGTPRTKYGFLDSYLVRGSFHVEGGLLKDGTGTLHAGGNQFSVTWLTFLTPERNAEIAKLIPGFPTKMEDFGLSGSNVWGVNSYGAKKDKEFLLQPGSSYCEMCHTYKFDYKSQDELFADLGNAKALQEHTISKGISCEECHGAGGHLDGGVGGGMPSNCERCHQRFNYVAEKAEGPNAKPEDAFGVKFKGICPSCGTEGSQMFGTAHYDKGMRCSTCHDPHEVTEGSYLSGTTTTKLKKECQDCHEAQTEFFETSAAHGEHECSSCHMPNMGSCEAFKAVQYPDMAIGDNVRASHVWNIKVDPKKKTLNPPEGKERLQGTQQEKGWTFAVDEEGHTYLDLMWSCARTSSSDASMVKGCHSPFQSELDEGLHFQDQQEIYGEVMEWQGPVKETHAKVVKQIARIDELMTVTRFVEHTDKVRVKELVNKARDIAQKIEKDGSWGVHGPAMAQRLVDDAWDFVVEAQAIMDNVGYAKK